MAAAGHGISSGNALAMNPVNLHELAYVPLPGEAEITLVAGDMGLAGHMVAGLYGPDLFPDLQDLPGELMPQDLRQSGDDGLGPRVPLIDVDVRSADRPDFDPDEDLLGAGLGNFHIFQHGSRPWLFFQDGFHGSAPLAD
jgi:hypothetical protein